MCPETFEVFEDCIGLYATDRTDADSLVKLIKDVLIRLCLPLQHCRGQCYDGASNMSGRRSGVATRIQLEEPRALYVHCMGHSLNLAVQDTSRSVKVMADAFDTMLELAKVFKYSAKKKSILLKVKADLSPESMGIRPLCPTRWTVRAESLRSVVLNYSVIHGALNDIIEEYRGNSEATSQARGIMVTMEKFSFLFGVVVGEQLFSITDTLSKALQKKTMCALEAKRLAAATISSLKEKRSDDDFDTIWDDLLKKADELECEEPILPRRRRAPKRIDEANSTVHYDSTPEDMYRRYYFEILDRLIGEIERRFESPSFTFYSKVEGLLENAAVGDNIPPEDVREVVHHFKEDLIETELLTELKMVKNVYSEKSFEYKLFKEKIALYKSIFPQTSRLLQLLLVMPATSATAERSFSSLRHVKSYLRTTMTQERLNHLMMMYIHQDRKINMDKAIDDFILANSERIRIFGKPKNLH